jgi:RNA polymerase sigma-70 factor (ECF subfamily)
MVSSTAEAQSVESRASRASTDESAFEELYQRYCRRVYTLCVRITGNADAAEDLTQEVFLLLHRKLGSFRGESSFSTWLHRVTVNRALMYLRKSFLRYEETWDDQGLQRIADRQARQREDVSPLDRIALEQAIRELPRGYRTVLVLHDIEGYCHDEIAALLGTSVGTTKSQLHKARMRIRHRLHRCCPDRHGRLSSVPRP